MIERFLDSHQLIISTLSPVHIGCGEEYDPTQYLMDEGVFYRVDPTQAIATDKDRDELLQIVDGASGDAGIKRIQTFFHGKRDLLIAKSTRRMPVGTGVQAFYDKRIGKTVQHDTRAINNLEIMRTAYVHGDETPILPGSSLKGAIRTALLDGQNMGKPLDRPSDAEKLDWKKLFLLSRTLADCLPQEFERDPMRMIRLGDAQSTGEIAEIYFALNLKLSGSAGDGPSQTLECLSPMALEAFRGDMALLDPKQARLFADQLEKEKRKKVLPREDLVWGRSHVVKQCNAFYRPHLLRDFALLGIMDAQWSKTVQQSVEGGGLHRLLNSGQAMLLRVGRHSGAESVTLNGVRHIYQPQSKKWVDKPSTVWLAGRDVQQQRDLLPFGWLLVEFDHPRRCPLAESAPELVKLAHRFRQDHATRVKDSDDRMAALRAKQEQAEQAAMEATARQAAQAAEAAAKEQRLAAMSSEQRAIEEFREKICKVAGQQPYGGSLQNDAGKLKKQAEAEGWSTDNKAALAELIRNEMRPKIKGMDDKKLNAILVGLLP
ncbi:MAG: type III-A CRISPR-associated RAMP protein Csm5 [Magnetococcales bacterium]|nr:type III-A CRISPR-associated RAMP protein Csm5 [Magnetococcales bacterium]